MSLTCDEILELAPSYVLGALDASTRAAVRDHLEDCSGAHEEFAEFGGLVPYLLDEPEPVAPRPELRDRVMASFSAATSTAAMASAAPEQAAAPRTARTGEVAGPPAGRVRWRLARPVVRWGLAAAAAVAIVALLVGNLLLQGQASSARRYADNLNRALALAATPGSRVAPMGPPGTGNGTAETPGGIAVLPANGTGVLVMHDLAPTQGEQVYEAWFVASGQAVPVGSFRVGSDGTGYLDGFATSAAPGAGLVVGLTRESGPGATKPTLPLVAAGNAGARSGQ